MLGLQTLHLQNCPTCFNLVLESILAVHQELVQVQGLLRDTEVDDFLQLFWLKHVIVIILVHQDDQNSDLQSGSRGS